MHFLDKKAESVTLDGLMQRRFTLSYRIFFTAVLFLLLPLMIVSAFLYRNDLESHRRTTLLNMQALSFKSSIYVHDQVHDDLVYLYQLGLKVPKNPDLYPTLEAQIAKLKGSTLLLLFREEGEWMCKWSSNENFVGQNFDDATFVEKSQQTGFNTSIFAGELTTSWFFPDPDQTSDDYLLAMITPWDTILNQASLQSPFNLSIVDGTGTVLATTDPVFEGKAIPAKNEYTLDGEVYSLFFEAIEDTPFSLLVSAKQSLLFDSLIKTFAIEIGLVFGLVILLGLIVTLFFTSKLAKPLKELRKTMERVQMGNLLARFQKTKFGFEINDLGSQFNQMLDHLEENIEKAQSEKNKRLQVESELNVARKIQDTLFPSQIPQLNFPIDCVYVPAKEVGGDFYDMYSIDETHLLIVIADSAGKGVFASLFSHSLRSLIRALATEKDLPSLITNVSKLYFEDANQMSMFTTAFIAILDLKTKEMHYASLGHPAAILFRQNQMQELETTNVSFGLEIIKKPNVQTITLQADDLLFFYSDGLNEQTNPNNDFFGKKRITDLLQTNLQNNPQQINQAILDELESFQDEQERGDDITFVTIKIT